MPSLTKNIVHLLSRDLVGQVPDVEDSVDLRRESNLGHKMRSTTLAQLKTPSLYLRSFSICSSPSWKIFQSPTFTKE